MTPSEKILIMRAKCIQFYRSYEHIILRMVKFLLVLTILLNINSTIGVAKVLVKPLVTFILALTAGFLSPSLIMILIMGIIVAHILSFNAMLGLSIMGIFIVIYIMFIRLYPKESLLILITIIAFKVNMQYAVLLIVPLFGGLACLAAVLLGVIFSFASTHFIMIIQGTNTAEQMQDSIANIITIINQNIITNKAMLATMGIFLVVFMIIYIMRNLSIDYAPYVAVAIGAVMNLLGFGLAILFLELNINVLILIVMTILSTILALCAAFLSRSLDYSRSEVVQFEDEDNYYYVKVVPKVSISTNNTKVEQVYTTTTKEALSGLNHRNYTE